MSKYFLNKLIKSASYYILKRNKKFHNLHKNESCYIFGNGASLKYYDLTLFNDKISIGCGGIFLHKDFAKLDYRYHYEGHPFFYYPFWYNFYTKKYEKNIIGMFYKKYIYSNSKINYFVSLSNYFGISKKHVYFLHHFENEFTDFSQVKLNENFTSMNSGLSGMIGLAICLGFNDITLVGCDYTLYPQINGHFYETNDFKDSYSQIPINKKLLSEAKKMVNLRVISPSKNYNGHIIPHIDYETFAKSKPTIKENYDIISENNLNTLNKTRVGYKIFKINK